MQTSSGCATQVVGLGNAGGGSAAAVYSAGWAALQVAATAVAVPVAMGLAGLLVWNVWLLAQNKTTIEYHEVRPSPLPPTPLSLYTCCTSS